MSIVELNAMKRNVPVFFLLLILIEEMASSNEHQPEDPDHAPGSHPVQAV